MKQFLALILLLIANSVYASAEGILPLSSFRLESAGIGSSGPVVIEGKQNERNQVVSLKVRAFGREYAVPKEQLATLVELPFNGVRISYEHGYAQLGGRTIYIQLQMGFVNTTRRQATVTLTEDGKVKVGRLEGEPAAPGADGNRK